jgi:hypothetical protein
MTRDLETQALAIDPGGGGAGVQQRPSGLVSKGEGNPGALPEPLSAEANDGVVGVIEAFSLSGIAKVNLPLFRRDCRPKLAKNIHSEDPSDGDFSRVANGRRVAEISNLTGDPRQRVSAELKVWKASLSGLDDAQLPAHAHRPLGLEPESFDEVVVARRVAVARVHEEDLRAESL